MALNPNILPRAGPGLSRILSHYTYPPPANGVNASHHPLFTLCPAITHGSALNAHHPGPRCQPRYTTLVVHDRDSQVLAPESMASSSVTWHYLECLSFRVTKETLMVSLYSLKSQVARNVWNCVLLWPDRNHKGTLRSKVTVEEW